MVTVYQDLFSPSGKKRHFHISRIVSWIKSGGKYVKTIEKIRRIKDKKARDKVKVTLPCILFGGEFRERNLNGLLRPSGLIVLDFDEPVEGLREMLMKDKYVHLLFDSPSGSNRLKAVIKIPTDNFIGSFRALEERYTITDKETGEVTPLVDKSGSDICRVCFFSYDPNVYFNEDSVVFETILEPKKYIPTASLINIEDDIHVIYSNLKTWLTNNNEKYYEGNRNPYLFKLICACNRFGIPQSQTYDLVYYDFASNSEGFKEKELEYLCNNAYSRYAHEHGISQFKSEVKANNVVQRAVNKETQEEEVFEDIEFDPPNQNVVYLNDIVGDIENDSLFGSPEGGSTFFGEMDKIFRWNAMDLNCWYGIPGSGKSELMKHASLAKCVYDEGVCAFFSPEESAKKFYRRMMQIYIGRTLLNKQGRMSKNEMRAATKFIEDRYFFVDPKGNATSESVMETFHNLCVTKKVSMVFVDPINQLDYDYNMQIKEFLQKTLKDWKQFAKSHDVIFNFVAHTNSSVSFGEKRDSDVPMPIHVKHIDGGTMTANKVDNVVCVHRPHSISNPLSTLVYVQSQKIKDKDLGANEGRIELEFYKDEFTYKFPGSKEGPFSALRNQVW